MRVLEGFHPQLLSFDGLLTNGSCLLGTFSLDLVKLFLLSPLVLESIKVSRLSMRLCAR